MKHRVVIIEDEPLASERLAEFLNRYDPEITILAVLDSIRQSAQWFSANPQPDLVFSDIELLDGNAFRIFEEAQVDCPVIFATAYDQFLLQAFEKNGIAYLLKPFEYEKLAAAMHKFEQLKRNMTMLSAESLAGLKETLAATRYKERFAVKARSGIYLLETSNIPLIQIEDEITFAYDDHGKRHILSETLNQLEKLLDPSSFFRLNRSEMVNIHFIDRLEPYSKDRLVVRLRVPDKLLIASASRTPALRRWIDR